MFTAKRTVNRHTAKKLIAIAALTAFGALVVGCFDGADLVSPASNDPGLARPPAVSDQAKMVASAKLRPVPGKKTAGQIEFLDQDNQIVVTGKCSGLDPSTKCLAVLHVRSTSPAEGCEAPGAGSYEVGIWTVNKYGEGQLKVVLKKAAVGALNRYQAVSVRPLPATGNTPLAADACGSLVFFE